MHVLPRISAVVQKVSASVVVAALGQSEMALRKHLGHEGSDGIRWCYKRSYE